MGALGPTSDPGVAADFPWTEICEGKDGVVDVGGGQGTLCCSLAVKSAPIHIIYFLVNLIVHLDIPRSKNSSFRIFQ